MPGASPFCYREEEAAREAARLGEELRKLQREWRDASAALDVERRRANDAVSAKDADRSATADKCEPDWTAKVCAFSKLRLPQQA